MSNVGLRVRSGIAARIACERLRAQSRRSAFGDVDRRGAERGFLVAARTSRGPIRSSRRRRCRGRCRAAVERAPPARMRAPARRRRHCGRCRAAGCGRRRDRRPGRGAARAPVRPRAASARWWRRAPLRSRPPPSPRRRRRRSGSRPGEAHAAQQRADHAGRQQELERAGFARRAASHCASASTARRPGPRSRWSAPRRRVRRRHSPRPPPAPAPRTTARACLACRAARSPAPAHGACARRAADRRRSKPRCTDSRITSPYAQQRALDVAGLRTTVSLAKPIAASFLPTISPASRNAAADTNG